MDKTIYNIVKFLILIITLIFLPLQIYSTYTKEYIKPGYINISIKMDKQKCLEKYNKEICSKTLEPGKYYFNDSDVKAITSLEQVTSVTPSIYNMHSKNSDNSELNSNQIVRLNLSVNDIGGVFKFGSENAEYSFASLLLPFDQLKQTGSINETFGATRLKDDKLIENTTNLESIIVPEYLANKYEKDAGDIVTLPVTLMTKDGQVDTKKDYFIAGVYKSKDLIPIQNRYIYIDYTDLTKYATNPTSIYNKLNAIYSDIPEHSEFFKSEETFLGDTTDLYDEIHIFTSDTEKTTTELEQLFPVQKITTSISMKHQIKKIIFSIMVMFITIGIVCSISYQKFVKSKKFNEKLIFIELSIIAIILPYIEKYILNYLYGYSFQVNKYLIIANIMIILIIYFPTIMKKMKNKMHK